MYKSVHLFIMSWNVIFIQNAYARSFLCYCCCLECNSSVNDLLTYLKYSFLSNRCPVFFRVKIWFFTIIDNWKVIGSLLKKKKNSMFKINMEKGIKPKMKSPILSIYCNQGIHHAIFCQYIFYLQVRTAFL